MYNMKYEINVYPEKKVWGVADGFKLTGFKSELLTHDHGNDHEK